MWGWLKKHASNIGKKIGTTAHAAIQMGKKATGVVANIGQKVSDISSVVAKGLAGAGAVATALGPEALPVVAGLEGMAGIAEGVSGVAKGVSAGAGDIHRGLDRATDIATKAQAVMKNPSVAGAIDVVKASKSLASDTQKATRSALQRTQKGGKSSAGVGIQVK